MLPGRDNAEDGDGVCVPVVVPGGDNAGGDNAGGGVDDPEDIIESDSVRNKARWNGEVRGWDKPNKPQKNPQLVVRLTLLC